MAKLNYYAVSGLFNGFSCLFAATLVIWKNPHGTKNRAFLPFALTTAAWGFFYAAWQMSATYQEALFFIRLTVAGAALIPVANFHALLKILDEETPLRNRFKQILTVISLAAICFAPSQYLIPRVEQKMDFPFWPVPGPVYHLLALNLFIPSLWSLYLIREKGSKASALTRNKMKWILIGHLVGYTGGISNNFLFYNLPIKPYLNILACVGVYVISAVFFRVAVVDIDYFLKRLAVHFLAFVATVGAVWGLIFIFAAKLPLLALVATGALLALLFYPFVSRLVDESVRRLTKGVGFSEKAIRTQQEKIKESSFTYQDLAKNLVNLTTATFPVEMAAVYFFDPARKVFTLSIQKGMKNPLVKDLLFNRSSLAIPPDDPLIGYSEKRGDLINRESLLNETDDPQIPPIVDSMNRLESEILAPLTLSGKARGLYVIGHKQGNRLFDEEEIATLRTFAQMGNEIMRYIVSMETELNHMALYSHDMNHDIRSLLQTLQFLGSPMAENANKERTKGLIHNAERVAENLYESFQTNRDRSVLIMKILRGEYEKAPVDLANIVTVSAGKFTLQAEKANVDYVVDVKPANKTMNGNEMDLTRIIDNLISNALRYLPPSGGKLEIAGHPDGAGYEISVKDNGEGIEPENLDSIWKLGWQAKDAKRGAAGLGLAIVKQIVQVHNGTIRAESQGKGSGTRFIVKLPYTETIEAAS
jgi:signal transduction histidine kinase